VCHQFAARSGLPPKALVQALRESYTVYKHDIKNDVEKQRRDRLDPFAVRQETVEGALRRLDIEDRALATEMVRAYEALREEHRQLVSRALETLQRLRELGIHLALLTNGNAMYQRRKIRQHQLAPYFDCILIEEEFGAAKPGQLVYLHALDQLQVSAQEAWMVGMISH